ncbi:MAG: right-handed parallel beta-helix repeat-containing protein [Roseiflexaceae bacterium]
MTARYALHWSVSRATLLLCLLLILFGPSLAPASAQRLLRPHELYSGVLLATTETLVTVTTSSDVADGNVSSLATLASQPGADGAISLREAILATNATPVAGALTIAFDLPNSGPGYNAAKSTWTITIGAQALPALAHGNLMLDGSTQPGNPSYPQIILNGFNVNEAEGQSNGITIFSDHNTIRGLTLVNFYDDAILITGPNAAANLIVGCYLGPDANGAVAVQPSYFGVELRNGAHDNIIGGADPAARNLISGNAHSGVMIRDATTYNNIIAGNWIGVSISGQTALKNEIAGVTVEAGAHANLIGGANQGNLLSGNQTGISIKGGVATTVAGNTIGLAADGRTPLRNDDGGIWLLSGARDNLIGGANAAARNIISANGVTGSPFGQGIYLASAPPDALTANNTIQGNYIGVDSSGNQPAGNYRQGILIGSGAQDNLVGGTVPGAGNVITYNGLGGVRIDSSGNRVAGNLIGVGADGVTQLGNQLNGVRVGGTNNTIGPDNMIAFNQQSGVMLSGSATIVLSNTLSSNARSGVCIAGPNNTLRGNLVQSNGIGGGSWPDCAIRAGVVITGTNDTLVSENDILGNNAAGVVVYGGAGNRILANSISENLSVGIQLVSGGNNGVAPPQLGLVTTTTVSGNACGFCRVEVFTDAGDEGKDFLGATIASSDGLFSQAIAPAAQPGRHVTATHTDSNGNTSPFAPAVSVPTSSSDPTPTPGDPPLRLSPRLYVPIIKL